MSNNTQLIAAGAFLGAAILLRPRPALGRIGYTDHPYDWQMANRVNTMYRQIALRGDLTSADADAFMQAADAIQTITTDLGDQAMHALRSRSMYDWRNYFQAKRRGSVSERALTLAYFGTYA